MSEKDVKAFKELRKLAIKASKQIKELKASSDRENPVDMDI